MKLKKQLAAAACAAVMFFAAGCSTGGAAAVFVQSVESLSAMGGIAPGDRFAGLVVSENVAEIKKDDGKTVKELLVQEGDDVTEGQTLFLYDTDQLQLELDRTELELEQLTATIDNYKAQINELEAQRKKAASDQQLAYTIQIQTAQLDLKEAELKLKSKETETAQTKAILENAAVTAPVSGRIRSISESGMDNQGNPLPYITIQQAGAFRVKGMIGELQRGGLMEGNRIKVLSRTDSRVWYGTVALIDYENPSQGNSNDMYSGAASDEMTSSSRYPFYVELDDTDGLLLGQHVYLELDTGDAVASGISVGSYFICYDEDGSTYVWAENRGKLEKRTVTLGEYNGMNDTYAITQGLAETDYIAFPDPELCKEGSPTTRTADISNDGGMTGTDNVVISDSNVFAADIAVAEIGVTP